MKNLDALFENKGELKNISINDLQRSEFNDFEITDIDALTTSINSMGLLTPISVIGPDVDGKYTILSGERRYTAIKSIREDKPEVFESVPCVVLGGIDLPSAVQKLIIEMSNVETRDFNKNLHYFRIVQLLKECDDADENEEPLTRYGIARKMAERLKMSPRYCALIVQVFEEGSPNLVRAVEQDEITMAEADNLRKMIDSENKKRRENGDEVVSEEDIDKAVEDMKNGVKAVDAAKDHIEKKKPKKTYTIDDIDNIDIDDFELPEPDENLGYVSSTSFGGFDPNEPIDETVPKKTNTSNGDSQLSTVYQWCNKLLKKDCLTDSEQDIVYLMDKIVEKFL